MGVILMRERIKEKVKNWVQELKKDKPSRLAEIKKKNTDLSKEIANYFEAKAKDRKYFY